eukprot:5371202-Heterocapsa_arctica.AAC.1
MNELADNLAGIAASEAQLPSEALKDIREIDDMAWIVQQRLIAVGEATFGLEKPEHKVKAPTQDRAEIRVAAKATQ